MLLSWVKETSNNSKIFLCSEDKIRPDLYFNQMPNFVEVKKAA